jgi:RNA polymerase sigma-70 factor (ECF subfamily)
MNRSIPEDSPDADCLASEGQEALYAHVLAHYPGALARLARAYEDHPDSRRDLLQDIHLALWKSFAVYDRRCSIRTWIYRVAHNVARTHVLRSRRHRQQDYVALEEVDRISGTDDGVRLVDEARVLERLSELIRRLQFIDRQTIVLYLEGLTAAQISEIVGLSPENVATKIHRIKHILTRTFHMESAHER